MNVNRHKIPHVFAQATTLSKQHFAFLQSIEKQIITHNTTVTTPFPHIIISIYCHNSNGKIIAKKTKWAKLVGKMGEIAE